jgi:hypothetical protein
VFGFSSIFPGRGIRSGRMEEEVKNLIDEIREGMESNLDK